MGRGWVWGLGLAVGVGLVGCGDSGRSPDSQTAPSSGSSPAGKTVAITGAGASFPYPIYQVWFREYQAVDGSFQVAYQPTGSGAGIRQFLTQTLDFGASDEPLNEKERAQFPAERGRAMQVPMVGGAVALSYNLPGVDTLKLSRRTYCDIVLGNITRWNDPAIAADNVGLTLPELPIFFFYRSDGSGTTFIFTNHLKSACPEWTAGASKFVKDWPMGTGQKANAGVAASIQNAEGGLGYIELAYALESGLPVALLENRSGNYVSPSPETVAQALDTTDIPQDLGLLVPDPVGENAYPISGLTWLLVYENYPNRAIGQSLKGFLQWALTDGQPRAEQLGYAPLNKTLAQQALTTVKAIQSE